MTYSIRRGFDGRAFHGGYQIVKYGRSIESAIRSAFRKESSHNCACSDLLYLTDNKTGQEYALLPYYDAIVGLEPIDENGCQNGKTFYVKID